MDEVRRRLASANANAVDGLAAIGIVQWTVPRGGFYLWCQLPDGQNSAVIATDCMRRGIILAPGNAFSRSKLAAPFLSFIVTQMNHSRIFAILAQVMTEQIGKFLVFLPFTGLPISTPEPEIAARHAQGTSAIGTYRSQSPATAARPHHLLRHRHDERQGGWQVRA